MTAARVFGSWARRSVVVAGAAALVAVGGCETAGQGAVSGAAVGSLTGLAIGSMTGEAGQGAAIGAIAGAVGGAVIGDQNRRRDEAGGSTPPPPARTDYAAASTLSSLLGSWNVEGTMHGADGATSAFTGTATATSDRNYFLKLDIRATDPRTGQVVEGTSVLAQDGGTKVSMVNSFSTSPEMRRFEGGIDNSRTIITLRQVAPAGGSRRVVLRASSDDRWTAEGWDRVDGRDQKVESLTFTRSR